jgi:uncharacterized membrane protein YccC
MAPVAASPIGSIQWARWFFALRIWMAVMLALGVAFWWELDGASSAGVCVAILALQSRGEVLEKAFYRMLGTIVGGIAAIVLVNLFQQTRDLYVLAYSAWLGLCVFAAGFLDGNRAYGAVLCGYTVSIVAIQRIDLPDQVFSAAVNRGAAIAVGIAATAFVDTVFSSPEITPLLMQRVRAAQAHVRAFTTRLAYTAATDDEAARILREITDRHPELGALSTESLAGTSRAAAARAVAAALTGEILTARRLAIQSADHSDALEDTLHHQLLTDLDAHRMTEQQAERALDAGHPLPNAPRIPIYRSWENAARNGFRAFVASTLAGFGFALTGWPESSLAWSFVGIVICLSANAPDPRIVGRAALVAMPVSVALAGITLFVILDGSDAFPLLCAGLSPAIIGGSLLITSPDPMRSIIGTLITVFTLVVVSPNNPQSYAPSTYAIMSFLMILAVIIVYVCVHTLFPVEDIERRAWVFRSARSSLRRALAGKTGRSELEALLLDASRIAALSSLKPVPDERKAADIAILFWLADLRHAAQRVWLGFDQLDAAHGRPFAPLRAAIKQAFVQGNTGVLRQVASALLGSRTPLEHDVGGNIALAALLMEKPSGISGR